MLLYYRRLNVVEMSALSFVFHETYRNRFRSRNAVVYKKSCQQIKRCLADSSFMHTGTQIKFVRQKLTGPAPRSREEDSSLYSVHRRGNKFLPIP